MTRRLAALRIGNFKAFADTQRIPLKPITLIFGPNSAGKSSFIHSLALAHEAQFGREKRSWARLDVHHTDIGGSAIDLGGFRQYIHRGILSKRVEWGAEIKLSALDPDKDKRLVELLASLSTVTINIALGIELDNEDRPKPGAEPQVESVELTGDGAELLRMSRRRGDGQGSTLRLDRLASDHSVFRQILKAIVESATTSEEMRPEDYDSANEAISSLLPELVIRVDQFFSASIELPEGEGAELSPVSMLFPVSKGNREEDIANTVRFYLPRILNDILKGLSDALADELKRLQYLGPLRSFPPRHLAFAEHEDANWYAGGGYAWDVVRRDDAVRESVNGWLGSNKLKTPYKLIVRSLVAADQLKSPLVVGLEEIEKDESAMYVGSVDKDGFVMKHYPPKDDARAYFEDADASAEALTNAVVSSDIDRIRELVLMDQRTNTLVTHRDVGIGISQVLPVLVMAYGSKGKLLAMEQPEIHLHPALQAELADVFIECALGERGNTFILETHSEHLILRLLRRIRETTDGELPEGALPLRPDDVSVIFVQPSPNGSKAIDIGIDPDGDFSQNWPDGFFAERAQELF